jgi:hypothetical protein
MTTADFGGSEKWRRASLDILAGELMCNSFHGIASKHYPVATE